MRRELLHKLGETTSDLEQKALPLRAGTRNGFEHELRKLGIDLDIRIIDAATGGLLRELTLDPYRRVTRAAPERPDQPARHRTAEPTIGFGRPGCCETSQVGHDRNSRLASMADMEFLKALVSTFLPTVPSTTPRNQPRRFLPSRTTT